MRILHLTSFPSGSGASRATLRLHQELRSANVNSFVLTMRSLGQRGQGQIFEFAGVDKLLTLIHSRIDSVPLRFYRNRKSVPWTTNWFPNRVNSYIHKLEPDIVHLGWVSGGFLPLNQIGKISKPIVWTLHDLWPLTGGCHYTEGCQRFTDVCGRCPMLNSGRENDLSQWIWKQKDKYWKEKNITLVAPSKWVAECAQNSSLFKDKRIAMINHGIDLQRYRPIDRDFARDWLGFPRDKRLLLFGAFNIEDARKGINHLKVAITKLASQHSMNDLHIIVMGNYTEHPLQDVGVPIHFTGYLHDDISVAMIHSAVDLVVVPSSAETFGYMALEAIACGTPVVAFNTTGLVDVVEHERTGYLAELGSPEDLAFGISWVLEDPQRWHVLSQQARQRAEEYFSAATMAEKHIALYRDLIECSDHARTRLSRQ